MSKADDYWKAESRHWKPTPRRFDEDGSFDHDWRDDVDSVGAWLGATAVFLLVAWLVAGVWL